MLASRSAERSMYYAFPFCPHTQSLSNIRFFHAVRITFWNLIIFGRNMLREPSKEQNEMKWKVGGNFTWSEISYLFNLDCCIDKVENKMVFTVAHLLILRRHADTRNSKGHLCTISFQQFVLFTCEYDMWHLWVHSVVT